METITAEELIRETGRSYRFVKRRLADAGLKPVGLDGRRIIFEADLARAAVPARIAGAGNDEDAEGERQHHRAIREHYAALTAKAEYETLIDGLIPRDDVEACLLFVEGAMRSLLGAFPSQNGTALCAETDIHEIHAMLTEACRAVLEDIGLAIERQNKAT